MKAKVIAASSFVASTQIFERLVSKIKTFSSVTLPHLDAELPGYDEAVVRAGTARLAAYRVDQRLACGNAGSNSV